MPKRTMLRLVRTPDGVILDPTGKVAGRGAYLHNRRSCWEKGLHGMLAHALKTELTTGDTRRLLEFMQTLPGDEESPAEKGKVRMD
jgi:predicted RNA-binding protein YlxR (DUF448 family)